MATQIFRLGAFAENIEGVVVDPDNALGEPGVSATGNTTGGWTAKWSFEAPAAPVALSPYRIQKLRLFCQRAHDEAADPVVRSATVRNSNGHPVYEFVAGAQLTKMCGPVAMFNKLLDLDTDRNIIEGLSGLTPTLFRDGTSLGSTARFLGAAISPNGTLFGHFAGYTQLGHNRVVKITDFGKATQAVHAWTLSVFDAVHNNSDQSIIISDDETNVGIRTQHANFGSMPLLAFSEKEVSPGVYSLVAMTSPVASGTRVHAMAFSPDGGYMVVSLNASFPQLLMLAKRDLVAESWLDISHAELQATASANLHHGWVSWVGSRVARPVNGGFWAWDWNVGTETLAPIAGVEGGQFGGSTARGGVAISPNGQWLAAINNAAVPEMWIEDLNNPGAGGRRTIPIPPAAQLFSVQLLKPTWTPDGAHVVVLAEKSSVSEPTSGYPLTLRVPSSGALEWCSDLAVDFPFSAAAPLNQVSFSSDQMVLHAAVASLQFQTGGRLHNVQVFDLNEQAPLEIGAVWELPCKNVAQPLTRLDPNPVYMFSSKDKAAGEQDRQGQKLWTPNNGGYTVVPDAPNYSTINYGILPWRGAKQLTRTRSVEASAGAQTPYTRPGASVSKDGKYLAVGNGLYSVTDNQDDTWLVSQVTVPELAGNAAICLPNFRWAPEGDPLQRLVVYMFWRDISDPGAPYHRFFEITPDPFVVYRDDLTLPGFDRNMHWLFWSPDGRYLAQYRSDSWSAIPKVWFFDGSGFSPVTLPSFAMARASWIKWHPSENVLMMATGPEFSGQLNALHMLHFDTVGNATLLDVSAFKAQIDAARPKMYNIDWEGDGKFVGVTLGYQPDSQEVPTTHRMLWEWSLTKLVAGMPLTPLPDDMWQNTGGYMEHRLMDYHLGSQSHMPRRDYFGRVFGAPDQGLENFAYVNADPIVDFTGLVFDAGWTLEIETAGGDNAVQLLGAELELDVNAFALPTPWNLDTIFITDVSARATWDWGPEGEPTP